MCFLSSVIPCPSLHETPLSTHPYLLPVLPSQPFALGLWKGGYENVGFMKELVI
jgi:hypothetical protein